MRVLDLFSGIGGFSLGLERAGFETVAFCEIDPYCRKVLKKHWPEVPIFEDIRKLNGDEVDDIGLICGGYPCQPFSCAGKREGKNDDRHLWPEMYRIIKAIRPRWVIAENVAGHISMGLDTVLSDLEAEGYTCWTFVIPACAVDAKHRRDRVWIVANANGGGLSEQDVCEKQQGRTKIVGTGEAMANTAGERSRETGGLQERPSKRATSSSKVLADSARKLQHRSRSVSKETRGRESTNRRSWPIEPDVGRVAHG